MKNIWKFMIVALMAIAMVGCPDPNDDDNKKDDPKKEGQYVKMDGVYSISGKLADISTAWGGSTAAPGFTIILLNDVAIEALKEGTISDPKELPVGAAVYQIADTRSNASFFTAADGIWKATYVGECAEVNGENFTLFLDGSKIKKTELKGIGSDFSGEKYIEKADDVDLTGYKPYSLALLKDDCGLTAEEYAFWNSKVFALTSGATYPADPKDAPAKVKGSLKLIVDATADLILTDVEGYKGYNTGINGAGFGWTGGDATTFKFESDNASENVVELNLVGVPAAWCLDECPWASEPFPAGFDHALKLVIGSDEAWVPFSTTGEATYSWNDRK